jgi:hypothetical protein
MNGQQGENYMTSLQRKAVGYLFALYGNAGPKYTKGNHEFIGRTLYAEEHADHYQPSSECREDLKKVLAGDFTPLGHRHQAILSADVKEHERMKAVAGVEGE